MVVRTPGCCTHEARPNSHAFAQNGHLLIDLPRLMHRWLWSYHFYVTYVDDSMALVPREQAKQQACLMLMLFCIIGLPLSLHKFKVAEECPDRN